MTADDWRAIPDFEGCYEINAQGQVRSVPRQIMRKNLSPYPIHQHVLRHIRHKPAGRAYVKLCVRCKYQNRYIEDILEKVFGADAGE